MFLKRLIFFIAIFCGFFFAGAALAADPLGICTCLDIMTNNEEALDSTEAVCNSKTIPLEKTCAWSKLGTAGCFCDSCTLKLGGFLMPLKQITGVTKEQCSGEVGSPVLKCKGCYWYEPTLESGCFCDLTVLGKTLNVMTNIESSKCTGEVSITFITYKNCKWKNIKPPAPPSTGSTSGGGSSGGGSSAPSAPTGPTLSLEELMKPVNLVNPLGGTEADPSGRWDLRVILGEIIGKAMGVAGSLVLLVFVYGGFMWLTAAGNPEHVKKGTQAMIWAVVGLFIIFASYGILSLVFKAMGTAGGGYNPWGVEGYTKKDIEQATEGCYCKETTPIDPLTKQGGDTTKVQVYQGPAMTKDLCPINKTGEENPATGKLLSECEWQKFQSVPQKENQ